MDSSRISLRPFKVSDAIDIMEWAGDDRVTQFLRRETLISRDEAFSYIKDVCIPHPWRRSICLDDRSIGYVSVTPADGEGRCRADLGYALAVQYWGQGITTMAVKMALASVFKDLPEVMRLQALADVENKGSQRVLEKAGFIKEGLLRKYFFLKGQIRDSVMYSFVATDTIPSSLPKKRYNPQLT